MLVKDAQLETFPDPLHVGDFQPVTRPGIEPVRFVNRRFLVVLWFTTHHVNEASENSHWNIMLQKISFSRY